MAGSELSTYDTCCSQEGAQGWGSYKGVQGCKKCPNVKSSDDMFDGLKDGPRSKRHGVGEYGGGSGERKIIKEI